MAIAKLFAFHANAIKYRKLLSQIQKRSIFIFEENHVFIEEENPQPVVTVEEELD